MLLDWRLLGEGGGWALSYKCLFPEFFVRNVFPCKYHSDNTFLTFQITRQRCFTTRVQRQTNVEIKLVSLIYMCFIIVNSIHVKLFRKSIR